jgi:hypothetical protein
MPQVTVRPYATHVDNRFETACIAGLLFEYFGSVVSGIRPSTPISVAVALLKLALVAFAVVRASRAYCERCCRVMQWPWSGGDRAASSKQAAGCASVAGSSQLHLRSLQEPLLAEAAEAGLTGVEGSSPA